MIFGNGKKGLRLNRELLQLEVVDVTDGDWKAAGVLVHDEANKTVARLLIDMPAGIFPMALGVIYCDPMPTFDKAVVALNQKVAASKKRDLQALLGSGETWSIGESAPAAKN
jgi:2-oxoglutarate ferredoxin oxidoreductase subunit beta